MKKIIFAFALATAVLPAVAQTSAPVAAVKQQIVTKAQKTVQKAQLPAAQRAVAYSKELQKKLSLNDSQYAKVLAVNTECINRKDALKQSGDLKKAGATKQIAQYRMDQYKTILTPDQLTKLKTMNMQGAAKQ